MLIPSLALLALYFIDKLSLSSDPSEDFALGIFVGLLIIPIFFILFLSVIVNLIASGIYIRKYGLAKLSRINKITFFVSIVLLIIVIFLGSLAYISYLNTPKYY